MTFNLFMVILILSLVFIALSRLILKSFRKYSFKGKDKKLVNKWSNGEFLEGEARVLEEGYDNTPIRKSKDRIL